MKKPYSSPTITPLAGAREALEYLLGGCPAVSDIGEAQGRLGRGIYEFPYQNHAGQHALFALDSNSLLVGWDGFTTITELGAATARLRALLDEVDPQKKAEAV